MYYNYRPTSQNYNFTVSVKISFEILVCSYSNYNNIYWAHTWVWIDFKG